jgi:hypothetical protein
MTGDTAFYERDSLNVESYDAQADAVPVALTDDVAFYLEEAQRSGGPILDLGGGTGRVAWPLAETPPRYAAEQVWVARRAVETSGVRGGDDRIRTGE